MRRIPQLFEQFFTSLELVDIVLLPHAFMRVASVFGCCIGRFIGWAGEPVWNLLEIVFSVVAPGVLVYLQRTATSETAVCAMAMSVDIVLVTGGLTATLGQLMETLGNLREMVMARNAA